jgi:hypothetical protein
MTDQLCALCVVRNCHYNDFTNGKYETYIRRNRYICRRSENNPISLLGGHGNRKIVYSAVLKGMV